MLTTRELTTEPEITTPVDLCDARGRLNRDAVAWSRQPLHRCNVHGHPLRKKRWNYWAVTSDRYCFSATVADVDYLGLGGCYFIDFERRRMIDKTITTPFSASPMPETVYEDVRFKHKRLRLKIADGGSTVRITAKARSFDGAPLRAEIDIARPDGHETLNVVIPWSSDRFQFTSKQNTLPASGFVEIGDERYEFEAEKSWAVLDYGRGVWRYNTFWNWGAASGVQDGHTIGLNIGGGWTDGTGMTENGLCIDGKLHKISTDLRFDYDPDNCMKPWRIVTPGSDRLDLTFEPFFERATKTNLVLLKSDVNQVFGYYSGSFTAEDGTTYRISDLLGWVEQQNARW